MRVLHLSTFDIRGGAARGAYWLHRALCDAGLDSQMLVGRKYGSDPTVSELREPLHRLASAVRGRLDGLPLRGYRKTRDSFWTIGWLPDRINSIVAALGPDIVHLHWTGGGFLSVDTVRNLPCPVVWTLRDMWAFTGGCHYTAGCERFTHACGRCPQLRSANENDLSRRLWQRKQSSWSSSKLRLVPISSWLADCARRSGVFPHAAIEVIPNGIDTTRFRPYDRSKSKADWNLSPDRRHILFGAVNGVEDTRKGFRHMLDAAAVLSASRGADRLELVVFGGAAPETLGHLGMPIRCVGQVGDDDALARLYSACDVMVVPSEQEAFGKTLVEAMACGTPAVAFASGGPIDIIRHGLSGYLAEPFCAHSLAAGILHCIDHDERARRLGREARLRAVREFEIDAVAARYRTLYSSILSEAA